MNKISEEVKSKLKELYLSPGKRSIATIAALAGTNKAVAGYYKYKWGFSKKRRAKRTKTVVQGAQKKEERPTLVAFINAYESQNVINKAILLTTVKAWVEDETKKLNNLA